MRAQLKKNKIARYLLLYWVVLVIWQNISHTQARSGIDLVIKIGLLGSLSVYYFIHANSLSYNIFNIIIFAFFAVVSFWHSGDSFSGSVLIAYAYPVLLIFLAFGIGNNFEIDKEEFLFFLNGIIVVVLCCSLYAVFFCWEQFLTAMSLSSAYGNEVSSFFISNHEYGMYLVYGIISCLLCMEIGKNQKRSKYYLICIFIFVFNLIFTYSRTSLLAMVCFVIFFIVLSKPAKAKKLLIFGFGLVILAALMSERVRSLLLLIIFKDQGMEIGAREDLLRLGIRLFKEGDWSQKLLGHGVSTTSTIIGAATDHGSLHNAYLQVLTCYGLFGLGYLLLVMLRQIWSWARVYRKAPFYSAVFIALIISAAAMMFTNTAILFTSPIDSYFLTMFVILVPKYVRNAIIHDRFDEE